VSLNGQFALANHSCGLSMQWPVAEFSRKVVTHLLPRRHNLNVIFGSAVAKISDTSKTSNAECVTLTYWTSELSHFILCDGLRRSRLNWNAKSQVQKELLNQIAVTCKVKDGGYLQLKGNNPAPAVVLSR
jgi:hypothetical protein